MWGNGKWETGNLAEAIHRKALVQSSYQYE